MVAAAESFAIRKSHALRRSRTTHSSGLHVAVAFSRNGEKRIAAVSTSSSWNVRMSWNVIVPLRAIVSLRSALIRRARYPGSHSHPR